jgi:hypothetical protein
MDDRFVPALVRVGFAMLAIAAVVAQFLDDAGRGVLNPVNFFSYFTIQSNLIGAAALLAAAAARRPVRSVQVELLRGAAAVYLTVTLVVFALLLSSTSTSSWMNTVLHRVFPVAVMVDWLLAPPTVGIPFGRSLVWLAYPVAWTAYTMARGALVGWYPYPFLDPSNGGYASVALYIGAIVVFGIVLCALVAGLSRRRGRWGGGAVAAS